MPEQHKPGEKAKESGQYPITGPRGGDTGKERTVTKGEPFPPTPKPGKVRPSGQDQALTSVWTLGLMVHRHLS